jgi:hypothetical protein
MASLVALCSRRITNCISRPAHALRARNSFLQDPVRPDDLNQSCPPEVNKPNQGSVTLPNLPREMRQKIFRSTAEGVTVQVKLEDNSCNRIGDAFLPELFDHNIKRLGHGSWVE